MTKIEKFFMAAILVIVPFLFIFWNDIENRFKKDHSILPQKHPVETESSMPKNGKNRKGSNDNNEIKMATEDELTIKQKWELPDALTEISGLAYISNNTFASIQDEEGTIFIYDLYKEKVTRKIEFGTNGDYEGIALVGKTVYVLNSNGEITEVNNISSKEPKINKYNTFLAEKNDAEGLCFDQKNNRLLVAIKGEPVGDGEVREIFAFDLSTKKMLDEPAFKIDLKSKLFETIKKKKVLAPSEIAIHPHTGEIYIIDGPDARLLVLENNGTPKRFYQLNPNDFPQAEGLSFNNDGELFIANEGGKNKGTIIKVIL